MFFFHFKTNSRLKLYNNRLFIGVNKIPKQNIRKRMRIYDNALSSFDKTAFSEDYVT